jgi:hypothetical protein
LSTAVDTPAVLWERSLRNAFHCVAYTFVFAVVDDFDDVVVVWLLQFKVDTRKFGRDVGMGNVRLNKALGIFKIVVLQGHIDAIFD